MDSIVNQEKENKNKNKNIINIGLLSPISNEWIYLHSDRVKIVKNIQEADYIIFESNGDPIHIIESFKSKIPKHKLVFILSGDQSGHIDNECIWFSNAIKPSGIATNQTQIFITNPAIFKFYDSNPELLYNNFNITEKTIDIYFKGTIWDGMRTEMYNAFVNKPNCEIIKNNNYWKWRCESAVKPTQEALEETAYDSYRSISKSKLCLCPKGNGNSSMRIIEALACGSIPILINDFSEPFGMKWDEVALVFDTRIHNWDYIYSECIKLISDENNNRSRYEKMQLKGKEYFKKIIYCDSKKDGFKTGFKTTGFKMYNNIDTVCFGFSNLIIDKLIEYYKNGL